MKRSKKIIAGIGLELLITQQCFASNDFAEGKDFVTQQMFWYSYSMNRTWLAGEMGSLTQNDVQVIVNYTTYSNLEGNQTGSTGLKRSYNYRVKVEATTSTASPFSQAEYGYYFGMRKLPAYFKATPNGTTDSN